MSSQLKNPESARSVKAPFAPQRVDPDDQFFDETALKHLKTFGLLKSDEAPMVILRRSRGQLLRRPRTGPVEVIASGRGDWIGWS